MRPYSNPTPNSTDPFVNSGARSVFYKDWIRNDGSAGTVHSSESLANGRMAGQAIQLKSFKSYENKGYRNDEKRENGDRHVDDVKVNVGDKFADITGCTLSAHGINYGIKIPGTCCGRAVNKTILNNISCVFRPGLNAILGPTGSGKTSFLNVLADRVDKRLVQGTILLDGQHVPDNFKCMVGYVVQDDVLVGTLTIRENFAFSAALRLPGNIKNHQRRERIEDIIKELGLQDCADTKIGTPFIRGVSGGERKRCNIGMELIISPSVLFLDEPTGGLDANTANTVIEFLRRLADRGRTIIFSIHQPRYSIYQQFDTLMLLSLGETVYSGPSAEALDFFQQQGYRCQEHNNPPDFFLDIINADRMTLKDLLRSDPKNRGRQMAAMSQRTMHEKLIKGFRESWWYYKQQEEASQIYASCQAKGGTKRDGTGTVDYATSFGNQMLVVAGRTVRDMFRNPQTGITTIGITVFFALFLIGVYWQLGEDPRDAFSNRTGLLFFVTLVQLFFNLSAMEVYIKEKVIFCHENISGYYRTSVYFLVKIFCDIIPLRLVPVLLMALIVYFASGLKEDTGAFFLFVLCLFLVSMSASATCFLMAVTFRTFTAAQLIMSVVYTVMMLFSGYLVNLGTVGWWFKWMQYWSIIKYGIGALYITEFKDRNFCTNIGNSSVVTSPLTNSTTFCKSGNVFLEQNNMDYKTDWDFWLNYMALALLAVALFALTYIQLRRMDRHN